VDPFDDFEFKPLTEGLGFHKKAERSVANTARDTSGEAVKNKLSSSFFDEESDGPKRAFDPLPDFASNFTLNSETENSLLGRNSSSGSQSISELIASLPPSLDFLEDKEKPKNFSNVSSVSSFSLAAATARAAHSPAHPPPQIFQPFARDEYKAPAVSNPPTSILSAGPTMGQVMPMPSAIKPSSPVAPAPVSKYRDRLDESYARAFPHADKKIEKRRAAALETPTDTGALIASAGHLGAGVVDAMVVAGMSTLLLVCILAITRVNLMGLLSNAETDGPTRIHLALLFISVLQLYMLTARSFFGASLGEWAFDLQLGTNEEQQKTLYPLQSAFRTLVITFTGFLILPVISLLAKRDLTRYISGLQLYRQP